MTNFDEEESVWCDVKLTENDRLLFGCIYRSPNSSISNDVKINKALIHANNIGFSHVLIMGDFNHPSINWYDSTSPPDVDHPSTRFHEAVRDSFMSQHVTEPTHYRGNCTPSTLDLILANEEGMVENIKYMAPVGKSHHTALCFKFCCYTRSTSNRESSYSAQSPIGRNIAVIRHRYAICVVDINAKHVHRQYPSSQPELSGTARCILELLCVSNNETYLPGFTKSEVDTMINALCTC